MKDISEKIMDLEQIGFKGDLELYNKLIKEYEEKNTIYLQNQAELTKRENLVITSANRMKFCEDKMQELKESGNMGWIGKERRLNRRRYKTYKSMRDNAKQQLETNQIYVEQITASMKKDTKMLKTRAKQIKKLQKKYNKLWKANKHQIKFMNYYMENQVIIEEMYKDDNSQLMEAIQHGNISKEAAKALLKQVKKDVKAYVKGKEIHGIKEILNKSPKVEKSEEKKENEPVQTKKDDSKDFRDDISNQEQTLFVNSKISRDRLAEALKGSKINDPEEFLEKLGKVIANEERTNNPNEPLRLYQADELMQKGMKLLEQMMEQRDTPQTVETMSKSERIAFKLISKHPEISKDYKDASQEKGEDKSQDQGKEAV